jgi:hypothetical protein
MRILTEIRILLLRTRSSIISATESYVAGNAILQHNAHFRDKRCQKRRQMVPKTAPLAPRGLRDREPLFPSLLSDFCVVRSRNPISSSVTSIYTRSDTCAVKCHEFCSPPTPILSFTTFAGPKYRKPKMGPHDLRAWSFEDGCLCSILHGLLQLQI